MKMITQRKGTNDCGICCVAMLADVSFEEAKKAFSSMNEDGSTKQSHVRKALENLGIQLSGRCGAGKNLDRSFFQTLGSNALLRIERSGENWHWAVWNAAGESVHDPTPTIGIRKKFPPRITGYYRVINQ
jgi:hypothetical protein